jgi:hypothetical protein
MHDSIAYYSRRIEEELAAADRAEQMSTAQIHRDMAQLYRDLLDSEGRRQDGVADASRPVGGLIADTSPAS